MAKAGLLKLKDRVAFHKLIGKRKKLVLFSFILGVEGLILIIKNYINGYEVENHRNFRQELRNV